MAVGRRAVAEKRRDGSTGRLRDPRPTVGPGRIKLSPSLWCPAMAALVLMAGCVGPEIEEMRRVEATGTDFTKALAAEYKDITLFEADEMYDWLSAGHFARKGLSAATGASVEAEPLEGWDLPEEKIAEMAEARARLLGALQAGARAKLPELAARAQGGFDCWIEQQSENHQPAHIARCRDTFYAALDKLEQAAAVDEPAEPGAPVFLAVLFFGFDSAAVSAEAEAALRQALDQPIDFSPFHFAVIGHTDSSGPSPYNDTLSLRRANAVARSMIDLGIDAERIRVLGRGELDPAVPTDSDTSLQANRRVEVLLISPNSGLIGTNSPKHGPVAPIIGLAPSLVTGSTLPTSAKRRGGSQAWRRRRLAQRQGGHALRRRVREALIRRS